MLMVLSHILKVLFYDSSEYSGERKSHKVASLQ